MWIIVVIIIIGLVIWAYSSAKKSEREQEEDRKKRERENNIKRDYPNAYAEYWGESVDLSPYYKFRNVNSSIYATSVANETLSDYSWAELERRILNKREAEQKEHENKEWEKAQNAFASKMRKLAPEILPAWGHYTYIYNITTKTDTRLAMNIWQHFALETCLEQDLDYTYNQNTLRINRALSGWQKNGLFLNEIQWKRIEDFISQISTGRKVVVFFNDEIEGWTEESLCITYMHIIIPESVKEINVAVDRALAIKSISGKELLSKESPDCVIVIDVFTTNDQLKKNCEYIFTTLQDKHPVLAYISLVKNLDRSEMVARIERSKAEALKKEAEEKAKAEERKRREEERAILQASAKQVLTTKAQKWKLLSGNFHYTWLLYYYPTTCDFDATDEEWEDRYTVWNFKNDPEKGISEEDHEATLDEVIPQIKEKLVETFGAEYLQFITLICLPASTKAKNKARYEEFSNRLCEETEMENGYPYVNIVKDGLPRHLTGQSVPPVVKIDDRVRGKYVLLFDDVITKGRTMLRYKEILERKGATVIGGFTIGKTKHERPVNKRTSTPSRELPHIFNDAD